MVCLSSRGLRWQALQVSRKSAPATCRHRGSTARSPGRPSARPQHSPKPPNSRLPSTRSRPPVHSGGPPPTSDPASNSWPKNGLPGPDPRNPCPVGKSRLRQRAYCRFRQPLFKLPSATWLRKPAREPFHRAGELNNCVAGVAIEVRMEAAVDRLLRVALERFVRTGKLRVTTADGSAFVLGDGTGPGLRSASPPEPRNAASCSIPSSGSAKPTWTARWRSSRARSPTCSQSWARSSTPASRAGPGRDGSCAISTGGLRSSIRRERARRNVAHHYDLDERLYSLFLDADRQYSCAYFEQPDQSLDDAQLAKKRHLAAKLLLTPGQRVLDIGCGWGGLALYLAEITAARVTGITLSQRAARAGAPPRGREGAVRGGRFPPAGLSRRRRRTFDRIVSVGMFEHVGVGFYDTFFRKCARCSTTTA